MPHDDLLPGPHVAFLGASVLLTTTWEGSWAAKVNGDCSELGRERHVAGTCTNSPGVKS